MRYENVLWVRSEATDSISCQIENKHLVVESEHDTFEVAGDYLLFPTMIDMNCSTIDKSFSQEALQKLSVDAWNSGVGDLLLCPEGAFPIDNNTALSSMNAYVKACSGAKIHPSILAINNEMKLSNVAKLSENAKAYFFYSDSDHNLILRVMQYAKLKNKPIVCFLRDRALNGDAVMNDGAVSSDLGLLGDNPLGERLQVDTIIEMAETFDVQVLIQGISTAKVLEKIFQAKQRGVKVLSELSIHHLLERDERCRNYNTEAKIEPPLREEHERLKLVEALKNAKVDILTGLHHPKSSLKKERAFSEASSGTLGFDALFSLYYTALVQEGLLTLEGLYRLTVKNPAAFLGIATDSYNLYALNEQAVITQPQSLYCGKVLNATLMQSGLQQ